MKYLLCILIGYLVGSFNPSYLLAKLHGIDIKKKGSGNAGASNALIIFGKLRGVICALIDIAKATFVIWGMELLFPDLDYAFAVTGVACILGHIFPFYIKFRGGKGLACLGGMILAYDWRVFLIMLAAAVVVALVTNYICFVPMSASVVFPVVYGIMSSDWIGALILCVSTAVILFKHVENIKRIRKGTELRLSYLWKKKEELERMNYEGEQPK